MEIRKRFFKNIAVLYITGKIDINAAGFIEETGRLLREGINKILCNFANVNIVDYNGLSILTVAYKNVVNQNGILKFCSVPLHIKELFKSARLDGVFEMHSEEEAALKSFDLSSKVDKLPLRRRFKRIDVSVPVRYKVGISTDAKLSKGKMLNLSGEGLFIYSKNTFPVSTQLYMELGLKGERKPLTLMGTVVWLADKELQLHSYPGMGITFTNIDKHTQARIVEFIDKNLTRRSKV
ncbi:MAG: PilZ domain-containing protein [Candidatus Omnitrophica bacterium]|nr:PilZ domain-containing protein [Candidatus Omnitrophota bacterium]